MKNYLTIMLLAVVITSCNKDEVEPTPVPTPTPEPTPTPFQYSGDNIAGKWKLDSVIVWDANYSNYATQDTVTYMPSAVGGTFTMEIYREVFNETNNTFDKNSTVKAGDDLKVDNRPHGRLYGNGLLSINQDNVKIGKGVANNASDQESTLYHFTHTNVFGMRQYLLKDNNHVVVTAENVPGTILWEFFTRVN